MCSTPAVLTTKSIRPVVSCACRSAARTSPAHSTWVPVCDRLNAKTWAPNCRAIVQTSAPIP